MVLDGPEVFLVTSGSAEVITLYVFSILYVCYADFSSLSMYLPFVTFVTLICTGTRKILFLSYSTSLTQLSASTKSQRKNQCNKSYK